MVILCHISLFLFYLTLVKMTEGLESNDLGVKLRLVSQLPEYGYNKGAMLAATHLLSESHARLKAAAGEFEIKARYSSRF